MRIGRFVAIATVTAAGVAAGCGGEAPLAGPRTSTVLADGGWIGGEPVWRSESAETGGDTASGSASADGAGGGARDAAATALDEESPAPGAPTDPPATGPLQAGSVDDNADLAGYLDYLARIQDLGIRVRPFDPSGRIRATVTGADGRPVAGAAVAISDDVGAVTTQLTDSTGRVVFLPHGYGDVAATYHLTAGDVTVDAAPGTDVTLTVAAPGGAAAGVPVDVLFLIDVTGSMGDEVAQLTSTMASVAQELRDLPVAPDIRFAMTLYRDEGDTFVTATHDFTSDVAAFQRALAAVVADGGGDTPEALDEGLAAALSEPAWRDPATTEQFVFLIADAAPQVDRQVTPYTETMLRAAQRGITVHAIGASQTDDAAEHAFRAIAQATGGRFVFLSYGAGGAALGTGTDIDATDYETMSLDALVVRLVGEALSALTGVDAPPPPTTTSTAPPQQQQGG
jgi:hypothetical protein